MLAPKINPPRDGTEATSGLGWRNIWKRGGGEDGRSASARLRWEWGGGCDWPSLHRQDAWWLCQHRRPVLD